MSIRTERVARVIQRDLADILGTDFRGLTHALVTVTRVRMSPDLSIAYVYLSVLGGTPDDPQATFGRIVDAGGQIRTTLAARIRHQVRAVPELRFFLDESQAHAERIEELLGKIRNERIGRNGAEGGRPEPPTDAPPSAAPPSDMPPDSPNPTDDGV